MKFWDNLSLQTKEMIWTGIGLILIAGLAVLCYGVIFFGRNP